MALAGLILSAACFIIATWQFEYQHQNIEERVTNAEHRFNWLSSTVGDPAALATYQLDWANDQVREQEFKAQLWRNSHGGRLWRETGGKDGTPPPYFRNESPQE